MRNPGTTLLEVWDPDQGEPVYTEDTGTVVFPEPKLVERVRGHIGLLSAEERFQYGRDVEQAEAFALVPTTSKATARHVVNVVGEYRTVRGEWQVAGVQWQRNHLRLLLKRP